MGSLAQKGHNYMELEKNVNISKLLKTLKTYVFGVSGVAIAESDPKYHLAILKIKV